MGYSKMSMLVSMLMVMLSTAIVSEAQSSTPACAQKLVPCVNYLNSTNPPPSCCTPLKEAVEQERDCLCNLYNTPGLLASLGINVTQALGLPKYCNVNGDLSCTNGSTAPSPASTPPPGKSLLIDHAIPGEATFIRICLVDAIVILGVLL